VWNDKCMPLPQTILTNSLLLLAFNSNTLNVSLQEAVLQEEVTGIQINIILNKLN
jgi:hypothetical protein